MNNFLVVTGSFEEVGEFVEESLGDVGFRMVARGRR